ncbi:MAG: hypothetical protein JST19_20815 [Bacteroidetes bacterium]|nr:hypothetical protein [Bacteroidota bacterium]
MSEKAAIIIPFYRAQLSEYEKIALKQCEKVLHGYTKIVIKPRNLILPDEASLVNFSKIEEFDDEYFNGIGDYNRLMMSAEFYERFLEHEYILIYQLDCFVFKDELNYWCTQHWDYIGAPWIRKTYHKTAPGLLLLKIKRYLGKKFNLEDDKKPNQYLLENKVGNGGFSLRRVEKFYGLCTTMKRAIARYLSQADHWHNEDVFWSIEVNRKQTVLHIPDCQTGLKFAFEVPPVKSDMINEQNIPFGCHDWDRYAEYWRPIFKNYGYDI